MDIVSAIKHEVTELSMIKMSMCISTDYHKGYSDAIQKVEEIIDGYVNREHQEEIAELSDRARSKHLPK